jgi:hypothetical protein
MARKEKGYTQMKAHAKRDRKRLEAEARQAKYDKLTRAEKIALATNRGGSQKELARLINPKVRQSPSAPVPTVVVVDNTTKKRTSKSEVVRRAKSERPSRS